MRQDLTVCALHHIQWLLNADNSHQFTDSHLWQYQALLLEGPAIQIWICSTLNLAKLFPETEEELTDNCQQVLMQTYAARADLQETPLDNPDDALHYESSFIENAIWKAAYAVVTLHGTLENTSLPSRASAQFAALIALTRALELSKGKRANTASKYAFLVLNAHGNIWKERRCLTATGSPVRYHQETNRLLQAAHSPWEIAIMHCKGHQKRSDEISEGKRLADQTAKNAAKVGLNLYKLL